jgi:acyl carrier protein
MTDDEIYTRITPIFREVFDDDSLVVRPDLAADDVNGWDSTSHIRLVLSVERAFSIRFAASEVTSLKNVGEFVALIQRRI